MRWRRRGGDADVRIAEAKAHAEAAAREVELSMRRQQSVREHVVKPLRRFAEHNQFGAMIEATLREGYGRDG